MITRTPSVGSNDNFIVISGIIIKYYVIIMELLF